jgi:hypothetical protein
MGPLSSLGHHRARIKERTAMASASTNPPAVGKVRGAALGLAVVLLAGVLTTPSAQASENGTSFYLLGSGGPGAAILPPISGVFLANTGFYYDGSSGLSRQFPINGQIAAGIHGTIAADFPTVLWVPTTNLGGATLALSVIPPFGQAWVKAQSVLAGPLGRQVSVEKSDAAFVLGDPVLMGILGWKFGKTSLSTTTMINVPVGDYREGQLANLAFHRWADDLSVAATWHDDKSGWDVSGKVGVTFNGTNHDTDYTTGTETHYEWAVEKAVTPAIALGFQGYYFDQISGDSGSGARLGPFEGQVLGIGGEAAYNFKIAGKIPATLRLHGTSEFDARNRVQGHSIWLDFTMPLHVNLPAGH